MARFAFLTLTDRAVRRVKEICAARPDALGVELSVRKGGCAGLEYSMDLVTEARLSQKPKPDKVEQDGAAVYIAPEAMLFLLGTEMDFETTALRTGFVFKNPNQTSACGCGESVEITPLTADALRERLRSA